MAPMRICKYEASLHNCTAIANPCGELRCKGNINAHSQIVRVEFCSLIIVKQHHVVDYKDGFTLKYC